MPTWDNMKNYYALRSYLLEHDNNKNEEKKKKTKEKLLTGNYITYISRRDLSIFKNKKIRKVKEL